MYLKKSGNLLIHLRRLEKHLAMSGEEKVLIFLPTSKYEKTFSAI